MILYFKDFSFKDFLSVLFSSTLLLSITVILKTYGLYDSYFIVATLSIIAPISLSHYFYIREHNRINNLGGRLIHDILIISFTTAIAHWYLQSLGLYYRVGFLSNLIVVTAFVVLLAEMLITFILKITNRIK